MILYISNKQHSKFKVVFCKSEINTLIPNIKWIKDNDGVFVAKNDQLSKTEIKNILKSNPKLDFLKSNVLVEVSVVICQGFTKLEFFKRKALFFGNKTAQIIGHQIVPIDNCPTFLYGSNYYVWKSEIGLFEIMNDNQSVGFYNSSTRSLVFKTINQYDQYLEEVNFFKSKLENNMEEDKERYVRVITVYDKITKELKYRILNEEFNYNSFAYINMQPIENDTFFFKSYLITEKIAKEYLEWSYLAIDFDFSKNEYYFETLHAADFSYPTADLFKNI